MRDRIGYLLVGLVAVIGLVAVLMYPGRNEPVPTGDLTEKLSDPVRIGQPDDSGNGNSTTQSSEKSHPGEKEPEVSVEPTPEELQDPLGEHAAPLEEGERSTPTQKLVHDWRRSVLQRSTQRIPLYMRAVESEWERCAPLMRDIAENDPMERARAFATRMLGRHPDPKDVELLSRLLREDASADVRGNAAWGLGEIGDPEVVPLMNEVRASDSDERVRQRIAEAIESLTGARNGE